MAVQRLTLSQIETAILQALGYSSSTVAPWTTSATLYLRVNEYLQRLPQKVSVTASLLRQQGVTLPYSGVPRFDMWKSSGALTCSSGSSTVYFPVDYDHYIAFWDNSNGVPIYPLDGTMRYKTKWQAGTIPAGPPEAIEIYGFTTSGTSWVRTGKLFPATMSGTTPSILLDYWRIPATMPGTSPGGEYPDIDPKYESIAIYGPIVDLSRTTGKEHERYQAIEKEMLTEMAMTARGEA